MSGTALRVQTTPTLGQILEDTRALAASLVAGAAARDRDRELPFAAFEQVRAAGIGTLRVPERFGGPGGSVADVIEAVTTLAYGEPNVAHSLRSHFNYTETLYLGPDRPELRHSSRLILDGALFGGAHTEIGTPRPGDIRTTLTREGGVYRLNGHKYYATGTAFCDYVSVSARRDDGEVTRLTLPVNRAGIDIRDDWDGMGQRLTASGSIVFDNVEVLDAEAHASPKTGLGWRHASTFRQLFLMACQAGIVRRILADAVDYAKGQARPITHSHAETARADLFVQRQVGEIAAISHAIDVLIADGARVLDRSHRVLESGAPHVERVLDEATFSIAKAQAVLAPLALKAAEALFNVGGASATSRSRNFDRHWRNIRTITSHNPLSYKEQAIGDWLLNETPPPVDGGYF
ncbi:acyl-CoA dehydrogenase family protein [Mesorhizobium sp. DCY119]|uniref:acyl-CoA dehydrogenase family protein n=1 Tax=Mesorhizobium sp. DCY119 TaxID=2108445 RepID=UPI000E773661|nr:acyl-CoA dehydrogenase family protein [Mesorhizobium sp. DCY119]RJG40447.1 acyl-CoA dehydrogenase [Mesorhizobium sp. DCY119]